MGRVKLPDGVPADNQSLSLTKSDEPNVPDVATPGFSETQNKSTATTKPNFDGQRFAQGPVKSHGLPNDDDDEPVIPVWVLITIAIVFLLVGLSAYLISHNSQPMPLCADQPEWNQYNCKVR